MRRTLEKVGIPRVTFYRWYDLLPPVGSDNLRPSIDPDWTSAAGSLLSGSLWPQLKAAKTAVSIFVPLGGWQLGVQVPAGTRPTTTAPMMNSTA